MKIASAVTMRRLDSRTINEYGIPGIVLMENAGRGTVELLCRTFGSLHGRSVVVLAGPGNNGGDGFVIARHLYHLGAQVTVWVFCDPDKSQGDARTNFDALALLDIPVVFIGDEESVTEQKKTIYHAAVIVDALFGTGLTREVTGKYRCAIEYMNSSGRPVVAVDIPSGLHAESGRPLGVAVQAKKTATFGLPQPAHVFSPGCAYCGELHVVDIGIPKTLVAEEDSVGSLLERSELQNALPDRLAESHKGSYGHALIVAGSQGKSGAALLAGRAALRSGSGLVTHCVPRKLNAAFEHGLLEAMSVPVGSDWFFCLDDYAAIQNALVGKKAVLVGPGIGTEEETAQLVGKMYESIACPMVVDADGLNVLNFQKPYEGAAVRILTPHPGEMARMMGCAVADIQADRLAVTRTFSKEQNAIVVLKGAGTVIVAPDGRLAINPTGNPAMATGGMGDVLAGILVSLLGQGIAPWDAVCLGTYVHGLAADRLVRRNQVQFGILASEVADELPLAFAEINGQGDIPHT